MSTPRENQQTVEALEAAVEHWVREQTNPLSTPESRWAAKGAGRAALRDLVAQAQESRKALRAIDRMDGRYHDLNTARHAARSALARLDGAR